MPAVPAMPMISRAASPASPAASRRRGRAGLRPRRCRLRGTAGAEVPFAAAAAAETGTGTGTGSRTRTGSRHPDRIGAGRGGDPVPYLGRRRLEALPRALIPGQPDNLG